MNWRNDVNIRKTLAAGLACVVTLAPVISGAEPWEVRREMREGAREIAKERREAEREIRRCDTRRCVVREVREGQREVNHERREARQEVWRERREDGWRPVYDGRHAYGPAGYYGNGRYADRRYDGWRYDPNAHYHPDGHFCRDGHHIAHLRDAYYRGDRRWYRDGRYWAERDYVNRYYRDRSRHHDDDDNDDLVRGIVIGAAAVGVIAAIHEANDGD